MFFSVLSLLILLIISPINILSIKSYNNNNSYSSLNNFSSGISLNINKPTIKEELNYNPAYYLNNDSSYCVQGTITWKTNKYKTKSTPSFPLINAEVDIYTNVSTVITKTNTDIYGNFYFNFKNNTNVWNNLSKYKIRVLLKSNEAILYSRKYNDTIKYNHDIFRNEGSFELTYPQNYEKNTTYYVAGISGIQITTDNPIDKKAIKVDLDYDYSDNTITEKYFQLYTMVQMYASHAKKLNSGINSENIPTCKIIYPCVINTSHSYDFVACYNYDDSVIKIPLAEYNSQNQNLYSFSSWDLIGHEYGHHLEKYLKFTRYATGKHQSDKNDCTSNSVEAINSNTTYTKSELGRNLAWIESWPTFYSIVAQQSFPKLFNENIYALGDDKYDAYNFQYEGGDLPFSTINYDSENIVAGGDACEESIIRFLYQLWNGNYGNRNELCSEKELWMDVAYMNGVENFYQFYHYLSYHHDNNKLDMLASIHKMTSSIIKCPISLTSYPTLSWDGETKLLDNKSNLIENYRYLIDVFNVNNKIITLNKGNYIYNTSYQFCKDEFEKLAGNKTYIKITKEAYNIINGNEKIISSFISDNIELDFSNYSDQIINESKN